MVDGMEHAERHPLERIVDWIGSKDEQTVGVVELWSEGPGVFNMDYEEFSAWIIAGMDLRVLSLRGLANIVKVNEEVDLPDSLPAEPPKQYGY